MKSQKNILKSIEGLSDIELFVIDLFCGAGGLSEGVEEARLDGNRCGKVVCCVNHDKNAILSHDANIPDALHFIEDIRTLELSPISTIVERIRQLYPDAMIMLHASLECTNFSKAKGGQPRDADSRTLAEHLFRYIDVIDPDYIQIENVEEFMSWGDMDENGKPISMDKGRLYQKWVRNVKKYGYNFEHRILNAADFGAYTTRKRFFGIFAKKNLPIVFPEPTHCKGGRQDMFSRLEKWKPVKDVLDFSDEGTTIFREKPLAEKTLERIYAGLIKFVAGGKDAFLSRYNTVRPQDTCKSVDEPCGVLTTENRFAKVQVSFLSKQFSGHPESKNVSVEEPAGAITCKDHHVFVSADIDMSELYIPPERFERDFITGRFLKGCVSRNKGRKMVYHSKRSKARSIKNLSKGRGAWHKTGAGMNKKSVVLIKDEKLCGVFPSIQMAGKMIGVAPSLISAICRKVRGKHTANGYRCFFEDSNDWYNLIKQDYE